MGTTNYIAVHLHAALDAAADARPSEVKKALIDHGPAFLELLRSVLEDKQDKYDVSRAIKVIRDLKGKLPHVE